MIALQSSPGLHYTCQNLVKRLHMTTHLEDFERGEIDADEFHHIDHVRVAFEMLRRYDFEVAVARFLDGLKRLAAKKGISEKVHVTITVAFVAAIAERTAGNADVCFEEFIAKHPELLNRDFIGAWYDTTKLQSDIARRAFVLPDAKSHAVSPWLVRGFIGLWVSVGVLLCIASVHTAIEGAFDSPVPNPHLVILGTVEAVAAVLFLIPRSMRYGALGLLLTIAIAFGVHTVLGQFRGDLLLFGAAVSFVAIHGRLTVDQWRLARPALRLSRDAGP